MDDNARKVSSYQLDQDILDARGIKMTVEEVAGLPTVKYSLRVQSLGLSAGDLAFLKGLRRRIKNRLASQNSRRRNMEHLRRLTKELRAVRACREDVLSERRMLLDQRNLTKERCQRLRSHIAKVLSSRLDPTEVPSVEIQTPDESHKKSKEKTIDKIPLDVKKESVCMKKESVHINSLSTNIAACDKIENIDIKTVPLDMKNCNVNVKNETAVIDIQPVNVMKLPIIVKNNSIDMEVPLNVDVNKVLLDIKQETMDIKNESINIKSEPDDSFECRLDNIVEQSVNRLYRDTKIYAKTVFISNDHTSNVKNVVLDQNVELNNFVEKLDEDSGVLNLCVKERKRTHGRKQSAPRRIVCGVVDSNDGVLDLKIKKN